MIPWFLGVASVAFLGFAALVGGMLANHLHRHGLAVSDLLAVFAESQHPTQVDLGLLFTAAVLAIAHLQVGLLIALGVWVSIHSAREQRCLLKLVADSEKAFPANESAVERGRDRA